MLRSLTCFNVSMLHCFIASSLSPFYGILPAMPTIDTLISSLNASDERTRRLAGDQLVAYGKEAIPALVLALASPAARVRQSASFLLGRIGGVAEAHALITALADEDPKVRKNCAVALGRFGQVEHAEAVAMALLREPFSYVRASLMLALGATGGQKAHALLQTFAPEAEEEREALRKALDYTAPARPVAVWVVGGWRPLVLLECPVGMERIAQDEVVAAGLTRPQTAGEGRLRMAGETRPDELREQLRCSYGPLLVAGHAPALPLDDPLACSRAVYDLVATSSTLQRWREWVATDDDQLRIRLAFGPHTRGETVRAVLEQVRLACAPMGISDSPSRYDAELVIESNRRGAQLLIRPSFASDERFTYRLKDVPAAVDPVIGAGLARLVRTDRPQPTVFDPTCGSGTLLIERYKLGGTGQLVGIDTMQDAVDASLANLAAAGLSQAIRVQRGDAKRPRDWPMCDEVLANLPFGIRTQMFESNIPALYTGIARNLLEQLRPGGRALFYTALPDLMDEALNATDTLVPAERLKVLAGGILVTVIVAMRPA
jgi:23S rRNA G2445 N2-methylase RlmL